MKKNLILLLAFSLSLNVISQEAQYYTSDSGAEHLCGPFELEVLETDANFQDWYTSGYAAFKPEVGKEKWVKKLKDLEVDIYLGTWCGDSKNWVPKFVKLWDSLGLDREQLNFIALYNSLEGKNKYKQGPAGEEKGKGIHRVPTFIFSEKGEEVARIVEYPVNSLETDLAQIAMGIPSTPNYRGASYLLDLFSSKSMEEIQANEQEHLYAVYERVNGNRRELNTLGYVLLEAGKTEEALLTFYFNTRYFKFEPNVYDSYAEALALSGQKKEAIAMYEKVLLLDRSNEHARNELKKLKE